MRFYLFIFFLSSLFFNVIEFVYSDCENVISVTNFGPENCDKSNNEYYLEAAKDTCIPGCYYGSKLGERCQIFGDSDDILCAPGLICKDFLCEIDQRLDSCAKYDHLTNNLKWRPTCMPDGSYAPKQCKGESQNGRCYCYDRFGKKIFGEEWSNKAQNMTCACSRHRAELELQGRIDVTLHCDSKGSYEPLQCDSGSCWCTDPQTGEVLDSVVSESMMSLLPCYVKDEVGDQYLRKCESQAIAQAKIKSEFIAHGTTYVRLPFISCDWDGSYGRYRVEKGSAYCTWRDNTNLGSWFGGQSEIKDMNCNCARDSKIYELDSKELTKACQGNGNYQPIQQLNETYSYCVDSDGYAVNDPAEDLTTEFCKNFIQI